MIRLRIRSFAVALLLLACAASPTWGQEQYAGTGIQTVPVVTGELVVLGVVPESPAERAGLRPGDFIVQVDDYLLEGSEFEHVARHYLWGKAGEGLTLVYLRPGFKGKTTVRLVREVLETDVEEIPGIRMMQPKGE